MDTGCERMMGGKEAVQDYIAAAIALGAEQPKFVPGARPYHVADGQKTHSSGTYWLPGWCDGHETEFQCDVGDWPDVPILMSMTTMRAMHMLLKLHPVDDPRGSWVEFPEGGPYRTQQLVEWSGNMVAFRPCITDSRREAELERGRVYWLEEASTTWETTKIPDIDFADDWSELIYPETWWALGPFEEEGEVGTSSFDQEQMEGNFAWAAVDPAVYKKLADGETDLNELLAAIRAVHENLGHTRNIEKLMRLFPPGYRDRQVFRRAIHRCQGCVRLGKRILTPEETRTRLLRATRPGHVYAFGIFGLRSEHTTQTIRCLHWVDIFSGFSMIIFRSPDVPGEPGETLRALKEIRAEHGLCEQMVMDRSHATAHEEAQGFFRASHVTQLQTTTKAPWANPVTRHSKIVEQIIRKLADTYAVELRSGALTLMDLALEALAAKNEMPGGPAVDGQSSLELKTGRRPRATELDDDDNELRPNRSKEMQMLCDLHLKAQVAALKARREIALQMARTKRLAPDRRTYERGDVVDFYTPRAGRKRDGSHDIREKPPGWAGPAVVIGVGHGCYILLYQNRTYWRGMLHLRQIRVAQLDAIDRQRCVKRMDRAKQQVRPRPIPPPALCGTVTKQWRCGRRRLNQSGSDASAHHPPADATDPEEPDRDGAGPNGPVDLTRFCDVDATTTQPDAVRTTGVVGREQIEEADLDVPRCSEPPVISPGYPIPDGREPAQRMGWTHRSVEHGFHHQDDADVYTCRISKACLYGVSTLRHASEVCEPRDDESGLVEEFFFDFPDPETPTSTTQSLTSFEGLFPALTDLRAPRVGTRGEQRAPAEGRSNPTVHVVLLATYLTQGYVRMRESADRSATTAVGTDWDESRDREVDAWKSFGTGRAVRKKDYPDTRVLKTRWDHMIKPDGRLKSRLCIQGKTERRQPSHDTWEQTRDAERMYYAITAEMKWVTKSCGHPVAYLENELEQEILIDLPKEARAYLGMKSNEVFMLHKNAHGTVDAQRAWQRTIQQEYEREGFVIHTMIPTIYLLFDEHKRLEGHSRVQMDNSEHAGGTKRFHDKMAEIQRRIKAPGNTTVGTYELCGRRVRQDPATKDIRVDLKPYAEQIERITIIRDRDPDSPLDEWETEEVRRVIEQALWYSSNAAPHVSFRASMLEAMHAQGRYACILTANELVDYIHRNKGFYLQYTRVAGGSLDNLRVLGQHDASKSCVHKHDWTLPLERMRLKGYAGRVYCFVDVTTLYHQQTRANLVGWRANKLERICTAPSSAETLAGVKCTHECMVFARHLAVWVWGPEAIRSETTALQMTDSENLMENIRSDFPRPIDTLLVPDLLTMRGHMMEKGTELRWLDTRVMCADPLTKEFEYHEALEDLAQRNKLTLVYVGEKRKYPKHLDRWEPARTLVVQGAP